MILTNFFSIYFHVKRRPLPLWPNSIHGNEDCKKNLNLHEDAFTLVSAFLAKRLLRTIFFFFFLHFLYTIDPALWPNLPLGVIDKNFNLHHVRMLPE